MGRDFPTALRRPSRSLPTIPNIGSNSSPFLAARSVVPKSYNCRTGRTGGSGGVAVGTRCGCVENLSVAGFKVKFEISKSNHIASCGRHSC